MVEVAANCFGHKDIGACWGDKVAEMGKGSVEKDFWLASRKFYSGREGL